MENIFDWHYGRNWYSTAKALKKASDKIREAYLEAYNQISVPMRSSPAKIDGSKLADLDQYPIAMMLMGYTMENIFRGIIICGMWLDDPKLVDIVDFADLQVPVRGSTIKRSIMGHHLRDLLAAKAMTLVFDEAEKDMMDTLDMFIVWAGRYATPKENDPADPLGLKRLEPIAYPYQALDSLYCKSMEELIGLCTLQGDILSESAPKTERLAG